MRIALRSLVWKETDVCEATLLHEDGRLLETRFEYLRGGIADGVVSHPDVFLTCGGSAEAARQLVNAVVLFILSAQGEVTTP